MWRRNTFRALGVWTVIALGAGCVSHDLGDNTSFTATQAKERLVWSSNVRSIESGRVFPDQIICAEPSPDTAEAIERSFQLMLQATEPRTGIQGGVGMGYGTAASIVQMTQRMATIQLLRDGLYRACEAYANGAIGRVEYSILLSRFDDTMITMLLAELIAGNFGGELASISAGGGNHVPDPLILQAKQDELAVVNLEQAVGQSQSRLDKLTRRLGVLNKHRGDYTGEKATRLARAIDKVKGQITDERGVLDNLKKTLPRLDEVARTSRKRANAKAKGAGPVVGIGVTGADRVKIAEQLATMQRKYIENINADALIVGCLSMIGERNVDETTRDFCMQMTREIVQQNGEYLKILKQRGLLENDGQSVWTAINVLANSGHGTNVMKCLYEGGKPHFDKHNLIDGCTPQR